ncbi:MAG: tRNA uridine-5-carboxymethylaminomethyl(34) synthesis GTPase MnmE [Erysipelotrichaceae bacterium]|nr:tRNA uridine-5-carboxymethylaminomethyl(34) synthesis GTPase MnmE [Erysipelotrichaceae bacterium]
MFKDTIVAVSTPLQEGAISIIRLSGDEAFDIIKKMFNKDLSNKKSHTITYGMIVDQDGNDVDEVLVSIFRSPKSYTMEDIIEINCHGGLFVTKTILGLCISNGARIARPGEFTERAFLNGRIDLTQAEGINDIIVANNKIDAKNALNSMKGSVTKLINPLIDDLLQIIANIEVNIDYPEYDDVEVLSQETVLPYALKWRDKINEVIEKAQNSMIIKDGIDTVILGKPNVGKSSLLNALLEEDKAIVTDIAGTTRDLVEGRIRLDNVTLNLIDTAGIRDTEDKVEQIGIAKSLDALSKAQLVIVVLDASTELDKSDKKLLELTENHDRIIVYNKSDIKKSDNLSVSALNNDIDELIEAIEEKYKTQIIASNESTLNNERQIGLAIQARNSMDIVIDMLKNHIELDLVTIDLQNSYSSLKEIIGESSREDLIDALFSRFCLGK